MNIAIVIAEFNEKVTSRMHSVAIEKATELQLNIKYTCKVPGIFDMPLMIDKLLQKKDATICSKNELKEIQLEITTEIAS